MSVRWASVGTLFRADRGEAVRNAAYPPMGGLQIAVAGEQVVLEEGDAFTVPASARHTFRVLPAAGRAHVLWVFSPALPHAGDAPIPMDQ